MRRITESDRKKKILLFYSMQPKDFFVSSFFVSIPTFRSIHSFNRAPRDNEKIVGMIAYSFHR